MHLNRLRVFGVFSILALALGLILAQTVLAADPDLKGRWKFDEGAGTTVADASGNGNLGTISGGPTWTTDAKRGAAMQFTANGYVDCGTGSSLAIGDAVSMAAWIKVGGVSLDHKVGGNQNNSAGGYKMSVYSNNKVEFEIRTSANGAVLNRDTAGGTTFQAGVWYHVAGVYSLKDGYIRTFVNGVLDREMATTGVLGVSPGPFRIGCEPFTPTGNLFNGIMDDVRVYSRAVTAEELPVIMAGLDNAGVASDPTPKAEASDVPRDTVVSWKPGEYAKTHDVYFGTVFDDVNTASLTSPAGQLASKGQDAATFDPAGLLAYGQTYYWRVDEVNAPDKPATYKGDTWSFTSEPYGYPVKPVKATASSSMASTMGPDKTIDGSGLDNLDQHGVSASQMWLSKKGAVTPVWIQYEFDKSYKLHEMWVWNSNQAVEPSVGFGAKDVKVETSLDGTTWTALADVPEFNQATGEPNYVHNTAVNFGGAQAKYVKLTISANWADSPKQAGLAEVRFFYVPVKAFGPTPADGAGDVAVGATLNWRPGREAAKHQLYLSADANAVANETVAAITPTGHSFDLTSLGLDHGRTYYWKVNEVNDAAANTVWQGDVWSFTTIAYAVVDDFEGYDDTCKRIFFSWVDGFGYSATPDCGVAAANGNATGSTVGNVNPPFAEQSIVHSGGKSMPMWFDNAKSPFYSEAQREWAAGTAWTGNGVNTLVVYLRGDAAGFVETTPGTIIMNGTGTDVWDASDQFRFVYKALKGNGSIVAKVEAVGNTNEWAKAGVMIRETAAGGSVHAFSAATPTATHGVSYQRRVDTNVATNASTDIASTPLPQWVKLTRTGNVFAAQYSSDGKAWMDVVTTSPVTINMANDVMIGLAVTSHAAGSVCGAKFTNVSTTGGVSGSWQVAEVGTAQVVGNPLETFYVAVQDKAGKSKVVSNPDTTVIATGTWQEWQIPLSQFSNAGVNLGTVQRLTIGVGDRNTPKAGGSGKLYIDDIRLIRLAP